MSEDRPRYQTRRIHRRRVRRPPRAIIRYLAGEVDDVVIDGDLFHMEQMADEHWWLAVYRGDNQVSFHLWWDRKAGAIRAVVQEDQLGCREENR